MKLPANNANHIKIPLSCLKITDNVRMNFDEVEIEELASSIRQNGLMNPITVRPPETDADGNKTYEVIAGGRRIRAHQWLCEHGDDFSLIECCIRTGDKWALQMIENIQRTDLTPREKENAVAKALEEGLTQTQIADKLSKPIQWVSDIVAGAKIRKIADAAGLNTEEITTKTLSQLRSIPEEKLESCLTQLIAEGGTYRAATRMIQEEKNPKTTHVSTSTINENLPNGLYLGVEVDKLGKRLFFKDLLPGKFFILNQSTDSLIVYKLCQIVQINKDHAYFSDGTKLSVNNGASVSQNFVDGNNSNDWIFDISSETKPIPSTVSRFKDDDESMISPSDLSEEEWEDEVHRYDNAFAESMRRETPEHDGGSGQERFVPGTIISHAGKRLFFADLYVGKEFVHANDKNSAQHLKVCKVSKIDDDCFEYIDGDKCCGGYSSSRKKHIDSEVCEHNNWIYEIPDDAVAVKVPDMQPVKTEPKPPKKPESFNWYIQNASAMESAMLILPAKMKKMPLNTKICVQAGSKVAEISSVIYEPGENRLIFRCLEDFGIH